MVMTATDLDIVGGGEGLAGYRVKGVVKVEVQCSRLEGLFTWKCKLER